MQRLDYEEQRQKIAQIAAEVIAREGIDAATFRRIAAEAGCSTTLLTNHFDDKRELLLSAYRSVSSNALKRFEERVVQNPAQIIETFVSLTAVDQSSWFGWRVYIAFWEKAIRDPVLASEQQSWIATSRKCIERAIEAGYGAQIDSSHLAQLVIALVHGISIQVLFEPRSWSHEQIHAVLSSQIGSALARRSA
jgi:AcrR family transcriptional regulator